MLVAWLGFIGYTALSLEACNHGSGLHQWDVSLADFIRWLQVRAHTRLQTIYR